MTAPRPILFGKLPRYGDFIARNLDPRTHQAWDVWASAGLERARDALGREFEAVHEAAPPWRFVSGPGAFGDHWRVGALAPSVDSAGRRFLVVLAADALPAEQASANATSLAADLEDLIYRAFDEALDADAIVEAAGEALAQALPSAGSGDAPASRWWTSGGGRLSAQSIEGVAPDIWGRIAAAGRTGAGG